jgi:hypothetical protein
MVVAVDKVFGNNPTGFLGNKDRQPFHNGESQER